MKKILSFILLYALLLAGCYSDMSATFDKPQPDNGKPLSSFPERLWGKYISEDKISTLVITETLLTRVYDYEDGEHKDSLGASYKISGDSLIDLSNNHKEKVLIKGDSVFVHWHMTDTLFNLSGNNVLKKFKGYYFLNRRYDEGVWAVSKLALAKGTLTLGHISAVNDINKLREITETDADTVSTHFALTKRQFKKFVRQDGFEEEETFKRIHGSEK